jgi:hypothetical protein
VQGLCYRLSASQRKVVRRLHLHLDRKQMGMWL